ncbi:MAG TPA: sigma-70 family RNA polymerase sigma factor [Chryseolinea sp.]|nr:sigma-70 family RNA polymerase sigma factor [Chryseolinea sp.]
MTAGNFGSAFDGSLLERLRSENPRVRNSAWTKIYQDNYSMAKSLVQRLGTPSEEFSDLYQDTIQVLIVNIETDKFRWNASISTYLYTVCKNICCRRFHVEKRKLQAESAFYDEMTGEAGYDFERDIMWAQAASIMNTELRDECRDVLEKFYFEGWSMEKIKVYFNLSSPQAAKNKKMRCLKYFITALKKHSINPELFKE